MVKAVKSVPCVHPISFSVSAFMANLSRGSSIIIKWSLMLGKGWTTPHFCHLYKKPVTYYHCVPSKALVQPSNTCRFLGSDPIWIVLEWFLYMAKNVVFHRNPGSLHLFSATFDHIWLPEGLSMARSPCWIIVSCGDLEFAAIYFILNYVFDHFWL